MSEQLKRPYFMMKQQTLGILFLLAAVNAPLNAEEYAPERYNLIVERSPFGKEDLSVAVPNAGQNALADKAAERELRLCFLFETDAGEARAGFENKTARAGDPKNVTLMEDDEFRGMKVLDIDLSMGRVIMNRDGNEVTFELAKPTAANNPAPTAEKPALPQRRFGGGFRPAAVPQPEPVKLSPEEEARKREAEALQRDAVRAQLQEYQMEVLRKGQPPLPVQLTPEMDDQLVAEGVLPPQ